MDDISTNNALALFGGARTCRDPACVSRSLASSHTTLGYCEVASCRSNFPYRGCFPGTSGCCNFPGSGILVLMPVWLVSALPVLELGYLLVLLYTAFPFTATATIANCVIVTRQYLSIFELMRGSGPSFSEMCATSGAPCSLHGGQYPGFPALTVSLVFYPIYIEFSSEARMISQSMPREHRVPNHPDRSTISMSQKSEGSRTGSPFPKA